MKVHSDIRLRDFNFEGRAKDNADRLCDFEMDIVENILEDLNPDGIDDTTLNTLFGFYFDTICSWLGYEPNNLFD